MLIFYVDNFRGFNKSFIPLKKVNFLVGENSTGKTSILSLFKFLSSSSFLLNPKFNDEEIELGYYKDIANKYVKEYFEFAVISIQPGSIPQKGTFAFSMRFIESANNPKLTSWRFISGDKDILINFNSENQVHASYKSIKNINDLNDKNKVMTFFKDWIRSKTENFVTEEVTLKHEGLPLLFRALFATTEKFKLEGINLGILTPFGQNLTWIAPIRAKPKRLYEQFKDKHTPEGEHMPIILKRLLEKSLEKDELKLQLEKFGLESGLWSTIRTKSIGKDTITSPFVINIKINKREFALANVGYGVSQVLPLIVEVLTANKKDWIVIQQPEVHLHPKAQASFGDFMLDAIIKKKVNFLIETHSEYIVNRFRMNYKKADLESDEAQILFFEKNVNGNKVTPVAINRDGSYSSKQPRAFKEFFINEELNLLEL